MQAPMLERREFVRRLLIARGSLLVVSGLGSATYDVAAAGDHALNFYLWGAMGGTAMIGLGLALAQPERRGAVITGDGDMLMGVGSLATIGVKQPRNLAIVVLDNASYCETGMQPSHTAAGVDLVAMARACRFRQARAVSRLDETDDIRALLHAGEGPVLSRRASRPRKRRVCCRCATVTPSNSDLWPRWPRRIRPDRWRLGRRSRQRAIVAKMNREAGMVGTFLRHGSNIWLALGLAALIVCFAAGILPFYLLWVVIGALSFYVSEYGFHRLGFHAEPSRFAFVRTLQHRLHYDHHAEPDRLDLLFLPVWFLIPNLAVTALIFALLFGWSVVASAMFGVALAIFHYEWVHYVAHIPYQPRTAFGRWIKQYHLRHHYISEKFWFGVSNPSMDLLGGTYKEAREVERSGTTRKLFG